MTDATANYALPFPEGTDPPDGAANLQALAEAIDDEFTRIATSIRPIGASSTVNLDLTGTIQDVPGTSLTFTTANASAVLVVRAVYDFAYGNTAGQEANENVGYLNVDGSDRSQQSVMRTLANLRMTVVGRWTVTLGAAGSHTVKLRAKSTRTAGTADCGVHSGWTALLID